MTGLGPAPRTPSASSPPTLASALHELAEQLERLRPNWQRPEIFFDLRADLATRLRDLALSRAPQGPWRPPERRPAISSRHPSASAASEHSWRPRRPSSSSSAGPSPRPCPGSADGGWSTIASSVSCSRRMGGRSDPSQRAVERQSCGLTVSIRPAPGDKTTSFPPPTHGRIAMTIATSPPCAARSRTRRCRRGQRASSLVAGLDCPVRADMLNQDVE
jgi:hypothetical protein